MTSRVNATAAPAVSIQLESLALRSVEFERLGPLSPGDDAALEANFSLQLGRPTEHSLSVDLSVEVEHPGVMKASVTYTAVFAQTSFLPGDRDPAEVWTQFAARNAPLVLYPYVRETMTMLTTKSGLPPFVPPILDFSRVFDPAVIQLPEPEQPDLAPA